MEETIKAEVTAKFKDARTGEIHFPGETIEVTRGRMEEILSVGELVREIEPAAPAEGEQPAEAEAPAQDGQEVVPEAEAPSEGDQSAEEEQKPSKTRASKKPNKK